MKRLVVIVAVLAGLTAGTAWTQEAAVPTIPTPAPTLKLKDGLEGNVTSSQTTVADQTDVAVTVYNNDRALVRDRRKIKLAPGELTLKFMDVAEKIQPETVSLVSLNDAGNLHILEQNYEYDLMSPEKLMEKYVGKEVTLVNKDTKLNFLEQKAKLLSVNNGPVYEVEGQIYLGHPGQVVLPSLPQELIAKPTLIWLLDNNGTDHEVEATYLTSGMSWKADYVLTMNKEETQMNIEGWVTLNNQSGAGYNKAQLKLVAGEVNIVQQAMDMAGGGRMAKAMMAPAAAPMQEESFAEYHLYTLPRRTTIKENQSKQVSLLSGTNIGVKKVYEFRGDLAYYSSKIEPIKDQNVDVFLTFENKEKNQLGMPLPAGVMRIYQKDKSDMYQFSGEDRIKHTAKDETVRLRMGKAFDVVADRVQSDFKVLGPTSHESAFKITVRNHKEVPITVDVVEPMPGMWNIIEKSADFVKKDAQTAVFSLPMKAGETVELTYRVRVQY
jgi:hypothetical protein